MAATAKVFENGRSQAVRIPKEYRFKDKEVIINRIGEVVLLIPKESGWDSLWQGIDMLTDDYMVEGRAPQGEMQERALL